MLSRHGACEVAHYQLYSQRIEPTPILRWIEASDYHLVSQPVQSLSPLILTLALV